MLLEWFQETDCRGTILNPYFWKQVDVGIVLQEVECALDVTVLGSLGQMLQNFLRP
jgi:hypothetical protein